MRPGARLGMYAGDRAEMGFELRRRDSLYVRYIKRALDFVVALLGLILVSPLLAVCAAAVRLESQGPVFFRQKRVGQQGKLFQIIKFRTMRGEADRRGLRLAGSKESRITGVGKWLRRTKIDEIPQLINVLRGEMSLVGPRPEVPEYVARYDSGQKKVLRLKPGMTGPASLAFADEEVILADCPDKESFYLSTLMPRKLELDLAYCEKVDLFQDIKLVVLTLVGLLHLPFSRKVAQT